MPQLIVRNLEASVVKKLRRRAATHGLSVEEAHRRLLRESLLGEAVPPPGDFLDYLRAMPGAGALPLRRSRDLPRRLQF